MQLYTLVNDLYHKVNNTRDTGILVGLGILHGALTAAETPQTSQHHDIIMVHESLEGILDKLRTAEPARLIANLAETVREDLARYQARPTREHSLAAELLNSDPEKTLRIQAVQRAGIGVINRALTIGVRNTSGIESGDYHTILFGFRRGGMYR